MPRFSCSIFLDYGKEEIYNLTLQSLSDLGFIPQVMNVHVGHKIGLLTDIQFDKEMLLEHLMKETSTIRLMNKTYEDENLDLYRWFSREISFVYNVARFTWNNIDLNCLRTTEIFRNFLETDRFICAFFYDSIDVFRQSNSDIESSKKNYPNEKIPIIEDYMRRPIVDTSTRWGRSTIAGGIEFLAAPLMWFGERYYNIISKEQFLSFPYCSADNSFTSARIVCKLFDWQDDPSKPENRQRQKEFWDFFDFKKAIEKFNIKRETDIGITDVVNEFSNKKKKRRWFW